MLQRRLAAALGALCTPALLLAQQPPSALERRVDSLFAPFSRTSTPGCAVGVDRGGAPLLRRAYGMANLETGTPFSVQTISESGSTAKQFVAAALVMLARDGVITLDSDVAKWVPEVKGVGRTITVRQLLSHTSGLPDRYALHDAEGRPAGEVDHPNAEVIDVVSRLRDLNFPPGDDYLYSNTGYVVAVAVLERASGKSLQAFTHERIFAPLGMTSTRWREDHRVVVPGRASAYSTVAGGGYRNEHPFTRVFGSGGLLLTVDDFLRWSGALQAGAGAWGAIRDSLESVIHLNDGTAITYGLGVSSEQWRGVRRVSHTGATGGYRAAIFRFPQQAVSVALLCNVTSANSTVLSLGVAEAVLGDVLQPAAQQVAPAIAIMPETLNAVAGRWFAPRTEELLILQSRNGQLVDSLTNTVILPAGADRFIVRGSDASVRLAGTGATATLRFEEPGARTVEFERVGEPRTALTEYVGTYASPELGAKASLVLKGGALAFDDAWRGTRTLTPLYRDGFALAGGERVRFTRDAKGRVTGYVVWAGRVRHLRYARVTLPR